MKQKHLLFLLVSVFIVTDGEAQASYVEISEQSGLLFNYKEELKMGGGAASFDFDNDGDDDIYVVGGQNADGLFENDGFGNFTDVSESTKISELTHSYMSTSVCTGDIDNDGYRELFIGTIGEPNTAFDSIKRNILLKYNPATSQYEDITLSSLIDDESFCMGAHFFDSNQDGYLDIYVMNYVEEPKLLVEDGIVTGFDHECHDNRLYVNQGDGTFEDRTSFYGLDQAGCTLAATSSDLDWDGDPDIIVANDFGKWLQPNQLFQNQGEHMPYEEVGHESHTNAQMYGMGIGVGDYDEDLDLDFYVTNIAENYFFENQGHMTFENKAAVLDIQNTTTPNGLYVTGWGAIMEDFDNDSYLDLFVSNGYVYSAVDVDDEEQNDELYVGSSSFDFTRMTEECGINFTGPSRGALFGDWNSDGALDLITITNENLGVEPQNSINYYQNTPSEQHWIGLRLTGTTSNKDAFGAKAIMYSDDRALMRELRGGDSHASQNSAILHFGLGQMDHIDSIQIYWPSGLIEKISTPAIDQYHSITEGVNTNTEESFSQSSKINIYPNPATAYIDIELPKNTNSPVQIKLLNSYGSLVLEQKLTQHKSKLELSNIPSGVYTLVCTTNSFLNSQSVIILTP
ncbi:MAG: FG-GAP-like repeat-containing protein [Bacteroidota bacterium]